MTVGLLKEPEGENRVALLPESVQMLIKMNVKVKAEKNAGARAFADDEQYQKAGAELADREAVLKTSNLLICINLPQKDDLSQLHPGQAWMSVFQPLTNRYLVEEFLQKKITSFSLDIIPRITRAQAMDVLSSMATVAGYKAVLLAAVHSPKFFPMFMTAAGSITPSKVLILGAGVAGLQAIATARRLGAVVEAFDVRAAAEEEVKSLGARFVKVEGARDEASAGGYAVEQTEEFKQKQRNLIHAHASKSNIIICTAQIPGKKAPLLITKETVEAMQPGSVIVDLAASTGGNCELSKNDATIVHKGVTIIGNSNLPSTMPSDASKMFGKNVINFLKLIITKEGSLNLNWNDDIVKETCVTHNGELVSERVKKFMLETVS
ncbi:MAG TPA: Re/Si-specific NAD(P)(+) transhydrogenase subunit alpha [Chitinophagales bacterium]|nr:Re/Si-specific NAD(P)(+) transhydrogenase subunit alpha [Chitinophagales bacterium]